MRREAYIMHFDNFGFEESYEFRSGLSIWLAIPTGSASSSVKTDDEIVKVEIKIGAKSVKDVENL